MSYKIAPGASLLLTYFKDEVVQTFFDFCIEELGLKDDSEVHSFVYGNIDIDERTATIIANRFTGKLPSYWLSLQYEYNMRNRISVTLPYVYKFIKGEVPKDEFEANIRFDLSEHLPSDIKGLLEIIGDSQSIGQNNHAYASLIEKFT